MERVKLFTIGQFAALHNINKKTLMWYDEIGLFKPAAVKGNGYRYYTYYQSSLLETILILRELNMGIPEIKEFLDRRGAEAYVQLLHKKIQDVDREIEKLNAIRDMLTDQCDTFTDLLNADLTRIDVVECEEEYLHIIASDQALSMEDEIEQMVESMKQHHFKSLHDTTYGSLISVSHLLHSEFDQYDGLFMKVSHTASVNEIHKKPRGSYLRAYCMGSWDKLPQRYSEILDYAKQHGLTLFGYAYETGVNEMTINSIDEYITRIVIPVKKLNNE